MEALLLAVLFTVLNLLLRASAWRNILIAARPGERFRWRTVTGAYLAGVGVNAVVPARGGDLVKLYLVHRSVPKTPYATIVSTLLAETLFDMVIGPLLLLWAFSRGLIPGAPALSSGKLGAFEWDVSSATSTVRDPRASHFWDARQALLKGYRPVLGLGHEDAWDVYFLDDRSAKWTGDLPPKPRFWMHQLGGVSEDTAITGVETRRFIRELVTGGNEAQSGGSGNHS